MMLLVPLNGRHVRTAAAAAAVCCRIVNAVVAAAAAAAAAAVDCCMNAHFCQAQVKWQPGHQAGPGI